MYNTLLYMQLFNTNKTQSKYVLIDWCFRIFKFYYLFYRGCEIRIRKNQKKTYSYSYRLYTYAWNLALYVQWHRSSKMRGRQEMNAKPTFIRNSKREKSISEVF